MPKKKDHRVVAEGLARGLSQAEAVRRAGYSDSTARKKGYLIVQRPIVKSLVTEALEKAGLTVEQAIKPYLEGLRATIVTRFQLHAKKTRIADPVVRMDAADRILKLMGQVPGPMEIPDPVPPPCTIHIHARRDPPADHPGPVASSQGEAGPGGSGKGGPLQQQAVIINVHPERDRPR